ncbi:ROK family protein [Amaricoccus sp.]|uniref:ROK family protein n=1 Tax=Amaricoccus sp. TaxID=1872485 RepID=UPI001B718BB1|nr:ROK family protein [Amaricoccus sp.]MBP7003191.1 ROK family protein [Amaricoccus sp.]
MTVLAIDIGGTKTLVALVREGMAIEERRMATDIADGPDALLDAAAALAAPWAGRYRAVGAAVTGLVRHGTWRALNAATLDLPAGFPLADALADRFGVPARCVNDAQAAAWGEHVAGAGRHAADMAFLTVSTGIGGGLVLGGRLLEGLAGHFGQFVDETGTRAEDRAAGRWIAAEAEAQGRRGDAAAVFARAGEDWAARLIATSAARVAALCRNVQLAVDPERIVVGGGIGLAPGYLDRVRRALEAADPDIRPRIAPASLGPRAGLIGAAALAVAMMETELKEETAT